LTPYDRAFSRIGAKMLHDNEYKRITDGIISMSIAIMMRDYKTAELGATEILASVQRLNKWRADLLTQKTQKT